ncbi:hypothetical protein [Mycolicibacterium tokaiense]|uniref:hypothetical protein n=1 Tax=Mycolicibacterium tokaiense TaxID=39695 RepID=UPI001E47E83D|nr:hypothetical protein [Mycolicibacterium tokaiense]
MSSVLSRVLIAACCAGAALAGSSSVAAAEPAPPPPPPPNINGFTPVVPSDYEVQPGLYGFTTPSGITCVVSRSTAYGCNGPFPGAPNGANMITGGANGMPGFTNSPRPLFVSDTPAKPLPVNSRLSYGTISCGVDGAGAAICTNSFDQTGFVLGPATSWNFGAVNPLLDRPEGTNPYAN